MSYDTIKYNLRYGISVVSFYFILSWVFRAASPAIPWDTALVQAGNNTFFFALSMVGFWYITAKAITYFMSRKGK